MKSNIYKSMAALGLALALGAGCASGGNTGVQQSAGAQETPAATDSYTNVNTTAGSENTAADLSIYDAQWDEESAVNISFSGTSITAEGGDVDISGSTLTITTAGTYVLSGDLTGSVVVDAGSKDTVRLVLHNVSITADTNAAIYGKKVGTLVITLPEGANNTLSDAAGFTYDDEEESEPNAALFAKDDLVINGSGALTVNAGFNNGIQTKDDLVIAGGSITVAAENHGIRAEIL